MIDVNFQYNNSLNTFIEHSMDIRVTANMISVPLFFESKKLAQAADEFPK